MIGKLIKYDLEFIYKQALVFYIIVILLAIVARITNFDSDIFLIKFIHQFAQGATIGFAVGMFINVMMRTWARFKYNIYGDESYLTHTLPIKRSTIWTAKFLSSILVTLLSVIVLALALFIVFWSPSIVEIWESNLATTAGGFGNNFWLTILVFTFAIFAQFVFTTQAGFMGIILGHRHSSHPMLWSVVIGAIIYILGECLLLAIILVLSLINQNIYSFFIQSYLPDASTLNGIVTICGLIYLCFIGVSFIINRALLNRGVNVD